MFGRFPSIKSFWCTEITWGWSNPSTFTVKATKGTALLVWWSWKGGCLYLYYSVDFHLDRCLPDTCSSLFALFCFYWPETSVKFSKRRGKRLRCMEQEVKKSKMHSLTLFYFCTIFYVNKFYYPCNYQNWAHILSTICIPLALLS